MLGSAAFRTGVAPGGALAGPWVKNSLWTAARIVPSLDLRFADNKSLVDATTGSNLVTFTRASSGTFVGSDGLIKTATTNLLLRSEEFSDATWVKLNISVSADVAVAPDGTTTADKLIVNNGTLATAARISQIITKPAAVVAPYTFTMFAKTGDGAVGGSLQMVVVDAAAAGNSTSTIFSTISGTVTLAASASGTFSNASSDITPLADGWYRCRLSFTTGTETSLQTRVFSRSPTTGDGTRGIFIWGAQLEQSSTVGEYIPTTSTINSAPRFDHNPTTGESLGLLVEEQRTNLLLRSEEFATTWTATRVSITSNSVTAPDGTTTADSLTEDTTASQTHVVTQSVSISTATSYTFSCFAKANTRPSIRLSLGSAGFTANLAATFNLQGGTVIGTSAGVTASITPFSNDWYRCSATATSTATASTAFTVFIGDSATTTNVTYTGDGTSGIYIWGAQLEVGAFPTSYIPTTTATVTRSADVASISGSNFSGWFNANNGTLYAAAESYRPFGGTALGVAALNNNSANNRIDLRLRSGVNSFVSFVTSGGTNQANLINTGTYAPDTTYRAAIAYALDDFARVNDGQSLATDSSGILPVGIDRLYIGLLDAETTPLNGTIRRLVYWPTRLPNSTLQAVTQ